MAPKFPIFTGKLSTPDKAESYVTYSTWRWHIMAFLQKRGVKRDVVGWLTDPDNYVIPDDVDEDMEPLYSDVINSLALDAAKEAQKADTTVYCLLRRLDKVYFKQTPTQRGMPNRATKSSLQKEPVCANTATCKKHAIRRSRHPPVRLVKRVVLQ